MTIEVSPENDVGPRGDIARMISAGRLTYKPGWKFKIAGPGSNSLCIFARTPDSNHPENLRTTQHQFTIPAAYDDLDPVLWIRDCLELCERHEIGEFLRVDGKAPFLPHHQGEGDPYEWVVR